MLWFENLSYNLGHRPAKRFWPHPLHAHHPTQHHVAAINNNKSNK
jgi:hypothetical protein